MVEEEKQVIQAPLVPGWWEDTTWGQIICWTVLFCKLLNCGAMDRGTEREDIQDLFKPWWVKGRDTTQLRAAPKRGYGAQKPVTVNWAPAMSQRCHMGGPLLAHSQPCQCLARQTEFAVSFFPAPCVFQVCLSFSCQVSSVAALCMSPPCWFPELGICPHRQTQIGRGGSLCWEQAWSSGIPPR